MRVGDGQYDRRLNLSHEDMDVTIIGNFDIQSRTANPNFQKTGWWYDYFSGDSIEVSNTQATILLEAGEFHIFTDQRLETPEFDILDSVEPGHVNVPAEFTLSQNYPNPFNPITVISWQLAVGSHVELQVYDMLGQRIATLFSGEQKAGSHQLQWDASAHASGVYYYRLTTDAGLSQTKKLVLLK